MKIQVSDYQHKADRLRKAIAHAGHQVVSEWPDALLIDHDAQVAHYRRVIERAYSEEAKILLYSHGAPVIVAWDGIWKPSQYVTAYLAQSPGQKAVMQAYKYPHPICVIGWHFCEQRKFSPALKLNRVLFAPWHPHSNGWLNPEIMTLNTRVYSKLIATGHKITVRCVRSLEENGLYPADMVENQQSNMTIEDAVKAIDAAQLVVSNPGTFASLAVARGKPVVMYGQDIQPHDGYSADGLRYVKSWDAYRDLMRYPYDITDSKPNATANIIHAAANQEAVQWRAQFIGEPFNPAEFVELLEGLCQDTK